MNCKDSEKPGAESRRPLPFASLISAGTLAMAFMGFMGMAK